MFLGQVNGVERARAIGWGRGNHLRGEIEPQSARPATFLAGEVGARPYRRAARAWVETVSSLNIVH